MTKKIHGLLKLLYRSKECFSLEVRKRIVTQLILPIYDYADIIYQNTSETNLRPLNVVYNSLCRFILSCPFKTHHCLMYESLNWLSPKSRRMLHWIQFIFKCNYFSFPPYLKQFLIPLTSQYSLRHTSNLFFLTPRITKEIGRRAFKYKAPSDWNKLPDSLRCITSFPMFKSYLFNYLQNPCSCFWLCPLCYVVVPMYVIIGRILFFATWDRNSLMRDWLTIWSIVYVHECVWVCVFCI